MQHVGGAGAFYVSIIRTVTIPVVFARAVHSCYFAAITT